MPPVTKTLGEGTQSVLLTIAILECLAQERHTMSISALAQAIGTSKSRIFRHLRTLLACDYVTQDEAGGHYGIGARLAVLCRSANDRYDLEQIAAPFMERLCERFRHSVILSRVERDGVHVLRSLCGNGSIVLGVRSGTVLPFERSAQGKIAIAFAAETGDADAPVCRARAMFMQTNSRELNVIREEHLASAQMREGLLGLAAPIFDAHDRLIGTLALLNTFAEMTADEPEARATLRRVACTLSHQLGSQQIWPSDR